MQNKKKILVVDDDTVSLFVITHHLANTEFVCEHANDGQEAWELLNKKPDEFSVVIADRIMPRLHGIDLLKKMHAHPKLKKIPLIMFTALAEKEETIEALKAGVFDFLYKPVEKDLLMAVLKKALIINKGV